MDDTRPTLPALGRKEKTFIVLLALLQALLLYLAKYAEEQAWPLLSGLYGRIPWFTLVLTVPTLMQLSLQRLDDRRFWSNALLATLAFGATAAWAAWSVTGAPGTTADALLGPFAATIALTAFVAAPYLQVRLAHGRFTAPYTELFAYAWQNALTLKVVGVMVCVGWLLLFLWQELFHLIGIGFFKALFGQDPFAYLVTGLFAGLGVLVARTQHRAMQVARQVLFAIFTGFLPLAAFIAAIFLASLPFTGLAPLERAASTASTLGALVAALVLLLNAVVQTGRAPPYPRPLRWLVDAAIVALPLFAAIALRAVLVRIGEHGWTTDRFWALIAVLLLLAYSLGYAWAVIRPGGAWMARLPRVNIAVSLALIGLGLLANSPVLDPHRLAVASQATRVAAVAGEAPVSSETVSRLEYLRFRSGRRGAEALERIGALDGASADFTRALAELRARPGEYPKMAPQQQDPESPGALAKRLRLPEGQPPLPAALLAVAAKHLFESPGACPATAPTCPAQWLDLDHDGREELLLCSPQALMVECALFGETAAGWALRGSVRHWGPSEAELDVVRQGRIRPLPPVFDDLTFGNDAKRRVQIEVVDSPSPPPTGKP